MADETAIDILAAIRLVGDPTDLEVRAADDIERLRALLRRVVTDLVPHVRETGHNAVDREISETVKALQTEMARLDGTAGDASADQADEPRPADTDVARTSPEPERKFWQPEIITCPKCGAQGAAFICTRRGCPVNGGPAYG